MLLATSEKLLGRAGTIGAFVKRGEDSGYTKITLRGDTPDEKIIIMRKIDARNKSEWLFNGRAVSKKEITEIIQKFNIQVNNLTQFLPQDRVCDFAKLSPMRLLEETEKAVGDPQLPVLHRSLVETSAELQRSEQVYERLAPHGGREFAGEETRLQLLPQSWQPPFPLDNHFLAKEGPAKTYFSTAS